MLDEALQRRLIQQNRIWIQGVRADDPYRADFESDQDRGLPQPPMVKAPMAPPESRVPLPRDFSPLRADLTLEELLTRRHSVRAYGEEPVTLLQLSYLLWACQGVKGICGKNYATWRTVPSGGARHPFETYLLIQRAENLAPGAYHYLPMEHVLEFLHPVEALPESVAASLHGQRWAAEAAVVFYWSMAAYRAEWRYGIYAHRTAMMDIGHVGQNLYLAAEALGLGTCAVAAFDHERCCTLFGLDGQEEFPVYAAPVGYPLR